MSNFPASKTTRKPLQKYNPGVLGEDNIEMLKMGVLEELWDISKNFVQTDEVLGDTYEKVDKIEIDIGHANALIETVWHLSVTADEVLGAMITTLEGEFESEIGALKALISEEAYIRLTADEALAAKITEMKAEIEKEDGVIAGWIKEVNIVWTNEFNALATKITEIKSEIEGPDGVIAGWIKDVNLTWADAHNALALRIETIKAEIESEEGNIAGWIRIENEARVSADEAFAKRVEAVEVEFSTLEGNLSAAVRDEAEARADADEAFAKRLEVVEAEFEGDGGVLGAQIEEERVVRATADEALATSITDMKATIEGPDGTLSSQIREESTARVDGDGALALSITTLKSTLEVEGGKIGSELTTIKTTVSTLEDTIATQITELESKYDDNYAEVTETLNTHADALGNVGASWGVTVDANGVIGGVQLVTDSTTKISEFKVNADKMVFTNGKEDVKPITIVGGLASFNNVLIQEDCVILGTLYADKVIGLPEGKSFGLDESGPYPPGGDYTTVWSSPTSGGDGRFLTRGLLGGLPQIKFTGDASIDIRVTVNEQSVLMVQAAGTTTWTGVAGFTGRAFDLGYKDSTIAIQVRCSPQSRGNAYFRMPEGFLYLAIDR